jgi:hypothetical protein
MIVYGMRHYGRIDEYQGTFIMTKFIHVWFLPLIPAGSHLVLEEGEDDSYSGISVGLNLRSMFAGYLRVWGVFGCIAGLIGLVISIKDALSAADPVDDIVNIVLAGFAFVVAIAMMAIAWGVVGRLSSEEKKKRFVYAHFAGVGADLAEMREARTSIREGLFKYIAERAQGLSQTGYRMPPDPHNHWPQIALDPSFRDADFVGAAFALSRVEGSLLQGPAKAQMEMTHHALWQKVMQLAPPPEQA